MTDCSENEIEHAVIGDGASARRHPGQPGRRRKPVEVRWPPTASERERVFERWEAAAMRCLRVGDSDFAAIIALRRTLRPNGMIAATNAELSLAAGCSSKTLEFDLQRLKAAGLVVSTFHSLKGFPGRRRVLRLSLPDPDNIARV